jgi:hypothetical protein
MKRRTKRILGAALAVGLVLACGSGAREYANNDL